MAEKSNLVFYTHRYMTIYNTDFIGQPTHSATVRLNIQTPNNYQWHNPVDADTARESTTRFDLRGRPTHTTAWLSPRGYIDDDTRQSLGDPNDIPIAENPSTEGLTTVYVYDDDLTDGSGLDAKYAAQLTALAGHGVSFGLGANGSAVEVTNPAGESSCTVQDGADRTVMEINAEGHAAFMLYDVTEPLAILRGTASEAPAFDEIASEWDAASVVLLKTTSIDALGNASHRFTDAAGRTLVAEDAAGAFSFMAYDARGRLITATDANLIETTYTYDDNGNLLSLTDGEGHTRQWTYDPRNLQVSKSYPADANDVLTYVYDALGRLVVKTQQDSSTIEHVYDLAGRITSRVYKNAGTTESTDSFTYDAASRLTATTKGRYGISTEHTYAPDGMPLSEKLIADSRTYTSTRSYDAANRPLNHTFPDGKSTAWTWDARHLVTSVTYEGENILSNLHDSGYRLRVQSFGNGLSRHLDYARQDHLRTQDRVNQGGQQVDALSHSYSYAADKQITAEAVAGGVMQNASFQATYDAGNRLASWTRPGQIAATSHLNQTWNYDDAGNWSSTTQNSNVQNRTHNASDQLTHIDGTATQLDPRGNLTEFTSNNNDYQLEYDLDNRLKTADVNNTDAEYRYDAFGRRVIRQQGTDKIAYIWWGDQETAEHQHRAGQATIQNDLWAHPNDLNTIVARAVEGSKYDLQWYHKNYLDHIYAVSDDTGDILEHYRYTAFGEVEIYDPSGLPQTETQINNHLTWNSRRTDQLTGFHYYKYRHYAPTLGRWLSRDPIEEEGGVNLYGFVGNDGVNRWDVLGLGGGPWPVPPGMTPTGKIYDPAAFSAHLDAQRATRARQQQIAAANAVFDKHLWDYINGTEDTLHFYGEENAWTQELMKQPPYDRLRQRLKENVKNHCQNGAFINIIGKWDVSAVDWNDAGGSELLQAIGDALNYVFEIKMQSIGGLKGTYIIKEIDCDNCKFSYHFYTDSASFRFGSMTRISSNRSFNFLSSHTGFNHMFPAHDKADNPNGELNSPFNTVNIYFNWDETLNISE